MREACVSISYSRCDKNGHIPGGPIWMLHWLPKGYGPSQNDKLLGVFFDTGGEWDGCGLRMPKDCDDEKPHPLPPLLQVVKVAIEKFVRENPDALLGGHFEYPIWESNLQK